MATAILSNIFDLEVIRTRDIHTLNRLDIIYDVGGGEYDHHGIEKVLREDGNPYAACGLIWKRFGREVIYNEEPSLNKDEIESVFNYVDRFLIEGIDASDNGVKIGDEIIPSMNISKIILGFNPPWYAKEMVENDFHEAVKFSTVILKNTMKRRVAILKAKELVVQAFKSRDSDEIVVLDTYCPWEETIQDIDEQEEVVFVVYPDKGNYVLMTVKGKDGSTKKYMPKNWAGKENEELSTITGVKDAVFCHSGRFIAVAGSFEGIMKMAELALKDRED